MADADRQTGAPGAPPSAQPDFYQVLGVPYDAPRAAIVRAYRDAIKAIHPDRQRPSRRAAAEEQAKALNVAYTTLANPIKRQAYDRTIRARIVQDQLMGRYVGGFYPAAGNAADPFGERFRREPTAGERREQAAADRGALVTLVVVFGGLTLALLAALLLVAVAGALFQAAS